MLPTTGNGFCFINVIESALVHDHSMYVPVELFPKVSIPISKKIVITIMTFIVEMKINYYQTLKSFTLMGFMTMT